MAYTSVTANPGTGGAAFSVDRIAGIDTFFTKLAHGGEGTATPVTTATPFPTTDAATLAAIQAAATPVGAGTAAAAARVVLPTDQTVIPIGLSSDKIYVASVALTPKFVAIAASSSGNNTLLAAVTSKKIRVLAYTLMGAAAVNGKFQSGASGTDLTGLKYIAAAGGGICAPFNPVGWFETAAGVLLNLNLSGGVAVGGELVYVEV